MHHRILAFACLTILLASPSPAAEVTVDGRVFRVPDGFVVEKVAGPPLVDRPIVADFDELGRLYVADSSGSNENVNKQLVEKPHRIVRLEDTDGDGIYDKSVVFADKMMFPEGAMWRDGSLYVAAPPSIWKLTDTDGDGKADRREEWFKGKTLTGCANDLHGPYNGPDGWIYWCKGAFAEQTYDRPGKPPFKTRAAHIFRARPDGSGIEPVMTGGMDNPVEIAFSPEGDLFFTTTFLQHPGGGRRDGLIHAIYGGVYGKDHNVLDGHPRTGPDLMPVMTHLGPAAPSGLMRYESSSFGDAYRNHLFAALFNLHKVTSHKLIPSGATFTTEDSDFLSTADDRDFHPTDVLEDADGSVLVLDTGGWYKLCCPTSQIGKPDVLGAVYRVRKAGAAKVEDPRGLKIDWKASKPEELAKLLDDPRPAVRRRAIVTLGRGGEQATRVLVATSSEGGTAEARRNAVWAACRMDGNAAAEAYRGVLLDKNKSVRQAAIHVAGLLRDERASSDLITGLQASLPNARASAEALGRLGDRRAVVPLYEAASRDVDDRAFEHSLIYALLEIAPSVSDLPANPGKDDSVWAGLILRDQLGAKLPFDQLKAALSDRDARIRETAEWIFQHHPEAGEELVAHFREVLGNRFLHALGHMRVLGQLQKVSSTPAVEAYLASEVKDPNAFPAYRADMLRIMARSPRKALPAGWQDAILAAIQSDDPEIVHDAVAAARGLSGTLAAQNGDLREALLKVAVETKAPEEVRLDALNAIPGGPGELSQKTFTFLREQMSESHPAMTRLAAADVIVKAKLSAEQRGEVADLLKTAGPMEASRLLAAFEGSSDDAAGHRLVEALKGSPALASMRVETLKPRFAKFGEGVRKEAEALYAAIEKDQEGQKGKIDELLAATKDGDIRRGQAIFNGTKAACVSCHAIGYLGGNVGPDLTSVGKIRVDRDLLESIVYPSASFVRSYEPMIVATKAGQIHSGVLKKDSAEEVVLAVAADKEVRVMREEIEEMRPGTVSVMPAGLDKQLSTQELADLLAFLRSRK